VVVMACLLFSKARHSSRNNWFGAELLNGIYSVAVAVSIN
jgi:hypothetical protein